MLNAVRHGRASVTVAPVAASMLLFALTVGFRSTEGVRAEETPAKTAPARMLFDGRPAPPATDSVAGFTVVARDDGGPQVALMPQAGTFVVSVREGQKVDMELPVRGLRGTAEFRADVCLLHGKAAEVTLEAGGQRSQLRLSADRSSALHVRIDTASAESAVRLTTSGTDGPAAVRWRRLSVQTATGRMALPVSVTPANFGNRPRPSMPNLHEPIERALIEWDWRMQDGIGTPREPTSYQAAVRLTLQRGDALLADLQSRASVPAELRQHWQELHVRFDRLTKSQASEAEWESLWRDVHWTRRRLVFSNPLVRFERLLFVKWVPSSFSHQLTQYAGRYARPGGGLFVLERPGDRCGADSLRPISYRRAASCNRTSRSTGGGFCLPIAMSRSLRRRGSVDTLTDDITCTK